MTANEMHNLFVLLSNASSLTNRNPDDREVSAMLNLGVKEFIDTRFNADSNTKRKGFESSSKREIDLAALCRNRVLYLRDIDETGNNGDFIRGTYKNGAVRNTDLDEEGITDSIIGYGTVNDADDAKYCVFAELPDEVLYIISENCDISTLSSNRKMWKYNIPVKPVTHDEYNELIVNTYKQPYGNLVWRKDAGSTIPTYNYSIPVGKEANPEFRSSATNSTRATPKLVSPTWKFDGTRKRIVQLISGKGWEVEKYNLYYIKQPVDITVDRRTPANQVHCELHPSVHSEVVQIAVRLYAATQIPLEQKYQIAQNEEKNNQ